MARAAQDRIFVTEETRLDQGKMRPRLLSFSADSFIDANHDRPKYPERFRDADRLVDRDDQCIRRGGRRSLRGDRGVC